MFFEKVAELNRKNNEIEYMHCHASGSVLKNWLF